MGSREDAAEVWHMELTYLQISWYSLEVRNHFLAVVITPVERAWAQVGSLSNLLRSKLTSAAATIFSYISAVGADHTTASNCPNSVSVSVGR